MLEDKEESSVNGMKLFSFDFNGEGGSLFGVSQDLNKLYKYIQIGETESKKNSWFFGDQVISGNIAKQTSMLIIYIYPLFIRW